MDFDEFRDAFLAAFRGSGLLTNNAVPSETLHLRTTERTLSIYFRAAEHGDSQPLELTGSVRWRWDALRTARTSPDEDYMLAELFAPEERGKSQLPWLRMDLELHARPRLGGYILLPQAKEWKAWTEEALRRLTEIALIDESVTRENPDEGKVSICYQADPEVSFACGASGELALKDVAIRGFQGIELPRRRDSPHCKQDKMPHAELAALAQRLKSGLDALGEILNDLRGRLLFPYPDLLR